MKNRLAKILLLVIVAMLAHSVCFAKDPYKPAEVSLTPKAGYVFHLKQDVGNTTIEHRHAPVLMLGLDIGGGGWVWQIAPTYSYLKGCETLGGVHAVSLYSGLVYKYHFKGIYLYTGGGFRGGYLFGSNFDRAFELYLRVPLGFLWYFMEDVGFFFEIAPMYGVLGLKGNNLPDIKLGSGFAIDGVLGIQFP